MASIEVVVVLPWVPATATERAQAQIDASMPGTPEHRDAGSGRRHQLLVAWRGWPWTR